MAALKLFIKRIFISLLKLSGNYTKGSWLPAGKITFSHLPASEIVYQHDIAATKRNPPATIGNIHKKFVQQLYTPLQKAFVVAGKNWRVWGNQGAVITDENFLFRDVSREFDDKVHSVFNQLKLIKPGYSNERVAVLAASGGQVYYHWMMDILPRIQLLNKKRIDG